MGLENKVIVAEEKLNRQKYLFLSEDVVKKAIAIKVFPHKNLIRFYSKTVKNSTYLPTNAIAIYFKNKKTEYEIVCKEYIL